MGTLQWRGLVAGSYYCEKSVGGTLVVESLSLGIAIDWVTGRSSVLLGGFYKVSGIRSGGSQRGMVRMV